MFDPFWSRDALKARFDMFVTPVIWVSLVIAWQNRSRTVTLSGVYLDEFFCLVIPLHVR